MNPALKSRFCFGIYAGGQAGTETGMTQGPADNFAETQKALTELQGDASLLVRCYIGYHGVGKVHRLTPGSPDLLTARGRKMDLVLCYQTDDDDMAAWATFIREMLSRYHRVLAKIQITEEANVNLPSLDGYFAHSRKALVEGVKVAKNEIMKLKADILVGFNATPDFNPNRTFYREIAQLADDEFYRSLDYVGLDFFPDVFRRVAPDGSPMDLQQGILSVLNQFKHVDLKNAGIDPGIELHITENGWPTHSDRSQEQQARILEKIITLIFQRRQEFNITHYELFSLRDANSTQDDLFCQFGILKDNYERKLAFETFKRMIKEFGA
jgi:hypothetical protein